MKKCLLINQLKSIPEFHGEIQWYENTFGATIKHPWEVIIDNLYIDFDICLPSLEDGITNKELIGLTVLTKEYELIPGNATGTYHINVEGYGLLDSMDDISKYILFSFGRIVAYYHGAYEKGEQDKLEKYLMADIRKWNWHAWVKQEEVISLLGTHFKAAAKELNIPERNLPEILSDYYSRRDRHRLRNLEKFLEKSDKLLNSSSDLPFQSRFIQNILNSIENGGETLNEISDLQPFYGSTIFN